MRGGPQRADERSGQTQEGRTRIHAIRVDDEENVGVDLTDHLDSILSIFATIVLSLH